MATVPRIKSSAGAVHEHPKTVEREAVGLLGTRGGIDLPQLLFVVRGTEDVERRVNPGGSDGIVRRQAVPQVRCHATHVFEGVAGRSSLGRTEDLQYAAEFGCAVPIACELHAAEPKPQRGERLTLLVLELCR